MYTIVSIWLVNGNKSTGVIFFMSYSSSSTFKSLTRVAGLQLIYTIFFGFIFNKLFTVFMSSPLLGGSTNTTSGITFSSYIRFCKIFSTSPASKMNICYIIYPCIFFCIFDCFRNNLYAIDFFYIF